MAKWRRRADLTNGLLTSRVACTCAKNAPGSSSSSSGGSSSSSGGSSSSSGGSSSSSGGSSSSDSSSGSSGALPPGRLAGGLAGRPEDALRGGAGSSSAALGSPAASGGGRRSEVVEGAQRRATTTGPAPSGGSSAGPAGPSPQGPASPGQPECSEPSLELPDEEGVAYRLGRLPTAMEGVNWWCCTVLGLLFITDLTPLGPLLLQGSRDAALYLAAVQWILFVLPTLNYCRERGWEWRQTFRLRPCAPSWLLAGCALGPLLWALTAAVVAARTGADPTQLAGSSAPEGGAAGPLFGELLQRPGEAGEWLRVLATTAVSPAVAEELLYRGFLLTALRQRFGSVDAAALTAALFAAAHLSVPQFFGLTLLGGACGGLALASGSLVPAVAAHAAYNATGVAVGVAAALAAAGRVL